MTTKTVNGIDVAYNKDEFTFFKYVSTDSDGNAKKKFAQCYFPIFIKQKINDDFVIHTQYNGKCGFNNFSHTQYIPNRKNAQVVTDISVTYYDKIPAGDQMQQALYKKGYIGYILVNVSCLLNKQQSVGVYFGDKKVLTLVSNGFSKASGYDYDKYWNYDPFLSSAYSYRHETALKKILKDVSRCAPDMTDYETYTALKYWIRSHSYSEYTCWGASTVGEAMTELGYAYTPLFCSYIKNNEIYNDYSKYYSTQSKQSHCALGHMVTLIYMKKGKYLFCEVQGSLYSDAEFKFDPKGWSKPTNSLSHALSPASDEFPLNEYTTIEDMMKGDYGINVNTYDPFNWHTWMPGLN